MKALHILSVLLLVTAPHQACAWGDDGHKTIALVGASLSRLASHGNHVRKTAIRGRPNVRT